MVTVEAVTNPGQSIGRSYRNKTVIVVRRGLTVVGMIVKMKNTKTDIFPWQVFTTGMNAKLLGNFFDDADVVKMGSAWDGMDMTGGRQSAEKFALAYFG
jgi:hypothetical protein